MKVLPPYTRVLGNLAEVFRMLTDFSASISRVGKLVTFSSPSDLS